MKNEIQEAETEAVTIVEKADSMVISDAKSYIKAGELWDAIKDFKEKIDEAIYKKWVKSTNSAHKEATTERNKFIEPLEKARKELKGRMIAYDDEQERIRVRKEIELRKAAFRIEENAKLQAAIEAEEAGQKEAVTHILEEPIVPPPVIAPKTTPKLQGGPIYREIWDIEIFDKKLFVKAVAEGKISLNAVDPKMVFLRAQERSLKNTMNLPGARAFSRRV